MIYVYVQVMGTRTCSLSNSSVVHGLRGTCGHAPCTVSFPWECKNACHCWLGAVLWRVLLCLLKFAFLYLNSCELYRNLGYMLIAPLKKSIKLCDTVVAKNQT